MPRRSPKVRADLEYFEQQIDGDDMVLVRDPIRGTYFRFNPLQGAMLQALDGHRTPEEITAILSEQYEVEIPAVAAERFIARARDLMLLDITAYSTTSSAARKEVQKALRKAGFRTHPPSAGELPAAQSAETALLASAFRELEREHPRAAASYLADLLDANPDHARARQLYDLIQTAYIRAAGATTDFPTWVLINPSRLLTWLSRTIGNFVFGWYGVLAMLAFLCIGAYAYTQVSFDRISLSAFDIAIAVAVITVSNLFHEGGHGLACQHFGGNVTEIGFTLFYYVQPAAYCDTSSSYRITERRHLVIIQMAGATVSLLVISAHSIVLAILQPSVVIYPGLALGLLLTSTIVFLTLIPLIKFDGYYALCDFVGIPNLRDRSFSLTRAWLSERLLGIALPAEELPARTRTLMIAYGLASFAFTMWFIYFGYARLLAPFVERLRGVGLVIALALAAYLLRNLLLRPIWALARLVVRERRRIFTLRRTAVLLLVAAAAAGPWFVRWPVLVDARFVVMPQQRADVRAETRGQLAEIFVREGDLVRRGQPLATLHNPKLHARIATLEAELELAGHRLAQVRRGARPEELAVATSRLANARHEIQRKGLDAELAEQLAQASLGRAANAEAARARVATSTGLADAARWALSLLRAGARREDIARREAEHARIAGQLAHLRADAALLVLRSPIDGVVVTPHLEDQHGAVLAPGDLFAEVHDQRGFVAEISLSQSDPLAELEVGHEIELRAFGGPHEPVHARIAQIRKAASDADDDASRSADDAEGAGAPHDQHQVIAVTSPFTLARPVSGLTGHARIYGTEHSLAYANLYLPLQRLLRVRMWSRW